MKIYTVTVTCSIVAHVVAESDGAAEDLAFDNAKDWMSDNEPEMEVRCEVADPSDWNAHELPYLTDEADDLERKTFGKKQADCDEWHEALKAAEPVVDTRTVPLVLRYEDGRVEHVEGVPQRAGTTTP